MDPLEALANGVYKLVARVAGGLLGRWKIVESVYVHRSVAVGEVSFGRSDIDLLIVVRSPETESADGAELASLYRGVSVLSRLGPVLGHVQMHDSRGLGRWMRTDTYRGSLDRRSSVLLSGKPATMPCVPVRREDAVRWFAWYPAHFFSTAVRERNRRNLRKIATEMWNAYAVAQGRISEPDLTRKEAEARALSDQAGAGLADVALDPGRAPDFVFALAKLLHDALLPPLEPLRKPMVFPALSPPRFPERVYVIVPQAGFPAPAEAFAPFSFFCTPELLHLYSHYVNPFTAWYWPPELRRLGFVQPAPREYVRACLFFLEDNMLRFPGFAHKDTWTVGTAVALSRHCVSYLEKGEIPPPMPAEAVLPLMEHAPACSDFYRHEFGKVYWQAAEQRRMLEELEKRFP
jgi:hypothetical protein